MPGQVTYHPQPYSVRSHQEAFTGIGAHWIVQKGMGKCGWGKEDMISRVALFENREDAIYFCGMMNARQEAIQVKKVGDIPCLHR